MVGSTYGQLLPQLLRQKLLPLGLYRLQPNDTAGLRYVATNPQRSQRLLASDLVRGGRRGRGSSL